MDAIRETARELVPPGKGILAADESSGTIEKRFDQIGLESTEDNLRAYRQLLFTTPGLGEHISGVILFDETIRQSADDGTRLTEVLEKAGVIPGIKVDTGAKPLAGYEGAAWLSKVTTTPGFLAPVLDTATGDRSLITAVRPGCAWPSDVTPIPDSRSRYSRPSAS